MVKTLLAQSLGMRLDARQPIMLDGGIRYALVAAGVDVDQPLGTARALTAESHTIANIHQRFCAAGVHVLRANTAETTPQALGRTGYGYRAAKLSSLAIDLAVSAAEGSGRLVGVAGVLPPMQGSDEQLRREQLAHAQRLVTAGCDLIYVDVVHTLRAAVAATAAGAETGLPVIVAIAIKESGHLPDGERLDAVCSALSGAGARGFLAAPVDPAGELRATVELSGMGRPWGVLRAGHAALSPSEYAERALALHEEGAVLFGGESFVGPEHVRAAVGLIPGADREMRRHSISPHVGASNLPPRM